METVHGIVTKSINFHENDKLLNILSREEGMIFVISYGARGTKNDMAAASQLFTYGEFMLNVKNNRLSLKSAVVDEMFTPIYLDYERYRIGSAMLMAINAAVKENDKNDDCYELLYYCLSYLAYSDAKAYDILMGFLLKLMQFSGYCPSITHCVSCGVDLRRQSKIMFSIRSGGSLCGVCNKASDARALDSLTLEIMRRVTLLHISDIAKIKVPDQAQKQVYSTVLKYAEHYLETRLLK